MSLFRRVLVLVFSAVCLIAGSAAFGPVAFADPPPEAENDGNGNSDSPGPGHGNGGGQENAGGSNAGGNGRGQGNGGGQDNGGGGPSAGDNGGGGGAGGTGGDQGGGGSNSGGNSDSNPDGGGLDKPDCESTAEGCQGPAPRDGNNGCGNEEEPKSVRDDDNNGNCGGGQKKDKDEDEDEDEEAVSGASVAAAAAQGAWTGTAGESAVAVAVAAGEAAEVDDATFEVAVEAEVIDEEARAEVLGVSVERAALAAPDVNLDDLDLARERSSRSGGRSLLALTGMAMLTLLAIGLFVLGLGRLFRGVEDGAS